MKTKISSLVLTAFLCFFAVTPARALDDYTPEAVVADTIIVRPVCFAATIVGTAFFFVSLPIAAISGSVDKTAKALVEKPAYATFSRPMGEFSSLE